MKYSEFKRKLELMGFAVNEYENYFYVERSDETIVATVSKRKEFAMDTHHQRFHSLRRDQKKDLMDLCYQLASTPLYEREDEKRYRLKLPFAMESGGYLNTYNDRFFVGSKINVIDHKTIFTESEIAELKQKYNLDSFVMEEVKEDE